LRHYDAIIVGAGHNGLICAAYLARSGRRVLVLEATDDVGGLARTHEFHPGFHVSPAHTVNHFSEKVAADLHLSQFGSESYPAPMPTIGLGEDGTHVTIDSEAITGAGDEDATAYIRYLRLLRRCADVLAPFWHKTMPRIGVSGFSGALTYAGLGLSLRRLGKADMREFLRIASLPARDLMDEFFSDDLLKAALSWDGLVGGKMAPRSPNSAILVMLYRMTGHTHGGHTIPANGIRGLIDALRKAAERVGVEIRCNAPVERIRISANSSGLTASGVILPGGEVIEADTVVSAIDPKRTFLGLVGVEYLDIGFTNRIRRLRCDGYVAKLHLALDAVPHFTGINAPDGRMIIAPSMDHIEFAFDDAKYGECSAEPVVEMVVPTLHDASLAPDGKHVLSAHVMYVPYRLKGGWTDAAREHICQRTIERIARYAPGLQKNILHAEFLTPADLERRFKVTGGHWHHTEFAIDQLLMMRPTYEAAQYGTPIPGLFLCSAGSHPGGDLVGAAGHNAAREILK
jgi:phytoene dehydrogenase-like protein